MSAAVVVKPVVASLPAPRFALALGGVAVAGILAWAVASTTTLTQTVLYVIGIALGLVLYHARFGFASAFRQLVAVGQGRAIRAHMIMLGSGSVLFAFLIANGTGFNGVKLTPTLAPLSLSLVVGAFLFGVGMQLAGACASGTLFSIGGGSTPLVVTLFGFIGGSVLGAWGAGLWTQQPQLAGVSLAKSYGLWSALAIQLVAFAAIFAVSIAIERWRRPPEMEEPASESGWRRIVRGSWPIWAAAIGLALLNALTFAVKGSPWGIAGAMTLWGSQALATVGVPVESWAYWAGKAGPLHNSVLTDPTSVMNFGIVLGAFVAATLSGTFKLTRGVPGRVLLAALIGGLLLGYGARIGYGCNIGAYFGGIVSFSLSGWIWGAAAIAGTYAGLLLRPAFGLTNPKPDDAVC